MNGPLGTWYHPTPLLPHSLQQRKKKIRLQCNFPKRPTYVVHIHLHLHLHIHPEWNAVSLAALAHTAFAGERLQRTLAPRGGEGDGVPGLARVLVLGLLVALVGVRLLGRRRLRVDVHASFYRERRELVSLCARFQFHVEGGSGSKANCKSPAAVKPQMSPLRPR